MISRAPPFSSFSGKLLPTLLSQGLYSFSFVLLFLFPPVSADLLFNHVRCDSPPPLVRFDTGFVHLIVGDLSSQFLKNSSYPLLTTTWQECFFTLPTMQEPVLF